MTSYTERAMATLHEWVQSEVLRKHCYAVAASMRHFAQLDGGDADLWSAVGLLHDLDFEQYPQMPPPGDQPAAAAAAILAGKGGEPLLRMHPFVGVAYLQQQGWSTEVCRAILAHADYSGVRPETALERTLVAVDELSSFVIAVALVRPTKSIFDVELPAVKKKMKDKAFARAVNREDITRGAEGLDMPLDDLIQHVITGLRAAAPQLGVQGVEAA